MGNFPRVLLGLLLIFVILFGSQSRALAITTGTLSGTVTDVKNGAAVADAQVTAISPSGNYSAKTDVKGFYILQGLPPDSYTVEVRHSGYQVSMTPGVTVVQGASVTFNLKLTVEVKTIGKVVVRGQASLVQPNATTDVYSAGAQQLEQLGGMPANDNEAVLLEEMPGVSATGGAGSSGGLQGYYPLIRGGLENNEGFQLEGIPGTEPLSGQFINNLILNGARSFNVVAGPGDATQGGATSGYVNVVAKRGTYPTSGFLQLEGGGPAFEHNLKFEYGSATSDGRFSYFFSGRYDRNYGGCCSPPYANPWGVPESANRDTVGQLNFVITNDTEMNLVWRFAKNNADELQLWQDWGANGFLGDHGVNPNLEPYASNDPFLQFFYGLFGLTPDQIPHFPGQAATFQNIGYPQYQFGVFSLSELHFSRRMNDTTLLSTRLYRTQNWIPFGGPDIRLPYLGYGFATYGFVDFYEADHTQNTGLMVDLQKSIADKHLLTVGVEDHFHNVWQPVDLPSLTTFFSVPFFLDFIKGGGGPFQGQRLPMFELYTTGPSHNYNAYITDSWKPNSHLTIQPGLRYEAQKINVVGGFYPYYNNALSPRLSFAWALNDQGRTVIRGGYGHVTLFAGYNAIETPYNPPAFYHNFPATFPVCGGSAGGFSKPCKDYWDEIYNTWWQGFGTDPYAYPRPQQSDSYEVSFEHEFPHNIQVKITPWYRRDYSVIVSESVPHYASTGAAYPTTSTTTNAGFGHSTGVELAVSRQVTNGISAQLNLNYINQFINYLSAFAFFPTVQPNILQTHTLAHPSYLSPLSGTLALDWRYKGWRVNPVFIYNHGYPIGAWQSWPVLLGNGKYGPVPNTNLYGDPNGFCYYVDPQAPGTPQNPNIVGSIGGGCTKSLNGQLTHADMNVNLTVAREIGPHMSVGVDIQNLLNNIANYPYFGAGPFGTYQNNGFGAYGGGSGTNPINPTNPLYFGLPQGAAAFYAPGPWFNLPSGPGRQWTFYVNYKL